MFSVRSSGVLLHVTSLASPFGIGDLGPGAFRFADFLSASGQRIWQVLPLVPTGLGNSPYSSPSTFAGNPLLLSPERLLEQGMLHPEDLEELPAFGQDQVDWGAVIPYKRRLLERAFERFEAQPDSPLHEGLWHFSESERHWLDDYALYAALSEASGTSWTQWPAPLKHRHPHALHEAREALGRALQMHRFWQFLFRQQWESLRAYCNAHGIQLLGDLPIYVAHDSADVWSHPHLFHLDPEGQPAFVAGVPPDYFSETGQRWGNPLYRWDVMEQDGYEWWTRRLAGVLQLVDGVRLDHFRGFAGYWEIPGTDEHAINGRWMPGPGASLFEALRHRLGTLPVVAEDLGEITPDVPALMQQFNLPGMAVLQFAFGGSASHPFLPHNYHPNLVAYTGTHDNDTLAGWWESIAGTEQRTHAEAYLGLTPETHGSEPAHLQLIRLVESSVAQTVILPLQDVLGLGSEARMNTPGEGEGHWGWRLREELLTAEVAARLREMTLLYGRASGEVTAAS